ncbi:MAG: sigma 54-interacting transcriptional regulator [Desulforhopalus sp.]
MISEPERLAGNQRNLLEAIPEIVLLIKVDGSIEYMNPSATLFIEQSRSHLGETILQDQLRELLKSLLDGTNTGKPGKITVDNHSFECCIGPFSGYKGEKLYWLTLKSLTDNSVVSREPKGDDGGPKFVVGSSEAMRNLQNLISLVSKTETTVLIRGESGTGKELVANLIRQSSKRHDKPFLAINCSAMNDTLLESDLFGYEKGAFTGANTRKKGKFEAVDGGTIFLDEIGDISTRMQAVLLRVLQHGEIVRVGGTAPISVDVRVVAATNSDLVEAVKKGNFRLDLFYRLNIFNISIPPLRERKEDILELTAHFVEKYSGIFERNMKFNSEEILHLLMGYDWPGNVRELENVIQRAILMSETDTIAAEHISFDMPFEEEHAESFSTLVRTFNGSPLKGIVEKLEKEVILHKLSLNRGNVAETAEKLDISKASLYEKMKRHDISAKDVR